MLFYTHSETTGIYTLRHTLSLHDVLPVYVPCAVRTVPHVFPGGEIAMPKITLGFAAAIILVSVAFWLGTGMTSYTALIPVVFGVALGICGVIGLSPGARKHAMPAAAAVALLSLLGLIGDVFGREGALEASSRANALKLICGLLLLGYLILSIRSFT